MKCGRLLVLELYIVLEKGITTSNDCLEKLPSFTKFLKNFLYGSCFSLELHNHELLMHFFILFVWNKHLLEKNGPILSPVFHQTDGLFGEKE